MVHKPKVSPYAALLSSVNHQLGSGEAIAKSAADGLSLSLEWIGHYLQHYSKSASARLLEASYSAAIEATSLVAFGFSRSAVFSLRSHYEFYLMFLYYKDHPVEWLAVERYSDSLKLPAEIKKYLKDYGENFVGRWSVLKDSRKRADEDCYGVLSAVSHGGALDSQPKASAPEEIIAETKVMQAVSALAAGVAENLFDLSVCFHDKGWMALPEQTRTRLAARLAPKSARKMLFD